MDCVQSGNAVRSSMKFAKIAVGGLSLSSLIKCAVPFLSRSTRGVYTLRMDSRVFHVSVITTLIEICAIGYLLVTLYEVKPRQGDNERRQQQLIISSFHFFFAVFLFRIGGSVNPGWECG
eukprot:TRINITY_DN14318_c0_g1_i1.p1 TRINITY_DN14318_c0_g1~~TRINITY_DN14318_c0_g1_i1.p1  ORF type:complete len:120 (-),score=10.72 TRINITY_DN14318_c0_g1_i1:189-548(-)